MAWSRDPRTPTRYMRGSKRYNDVGGHSPPGDELENTRDHERIWFELRRSRSCCDCTEPGFKYCFDTFDYKNYICDGAFPGGDTLVGYWPGEVFDNGIADGVKKECAGTDIVSSTLAHLTGHVKGSWRNGRYFEMGTADLDMQNAGFNWSNFFPDQQRTLEAWIRPSATDISSGKSIIRRGLSGEFLSQGGLNVYFRSDGSVGLEHTEIADGEMQQSGPGWWEADQWHHFALVRDAERDSIAIFINGRVALQRFLPDDTWDVITSPSTPAIILAAGAWADIAYYTSALSATIIRRHYQAVYGVEGAANPLSSTDANIEDPGTVIVNQISVDLIDGNQEPGSIVISQGDYAAYVTPENTPFELEERKSTAGGYASLDADVHVPAVELGEEWAADAASAEYVLTRDALGVRVWTPGEPVPKPDALGQMVQALPNTSDEYLAYLPTLWPGGYSHWALTQSASPWIDSPTSSYGDLVTDDTAPTVSTDEPICFHGESYLVFDDDTDGLVSVSTVVGPSGRTQMSFWIRLDELPASTVNIVRFDTRAGLRLLTDGKVQVWTDSTTRCTSSVALPVGEWAHVVYANDGAGGGTSSKIWINGAPAGTGSGGFVQEFVAIWLAGDGLRAAVSHLAHSAVELDGGSTATDAHVLSLYQTRRPVWTLIDEVSGGVSGVDASLDDTPVTAAPRPRFNFKQGANVTITVTDDSGDDEVEVEIAAALESAGDGIEVSENDVDTTAAPRTRLNFKDGYGTTVSVTDDSGDDEAEIVVDLPDGSGGAEGDTLQLDGSLLPIWAEPPSGLPDPSAEDDGQVLTTDSGTAVWAAPAGGSTGTSLSVDVAQTAHGFAVGDVVRRDSGAYALSQADSSANAEVDGIVSAVADVDNFTLILSGEVTGLSGLTDGETYFLSAGSAGALTSTEPSTTGEVSKPLLRATGTTTGFFFNWRGAIVQ